MVFRLFKLFVYLIIYETNLNSRWYGAHIARNIEVEVEDGRIVGGLDTQLNIIKLIGNNEYLEIIRNFITSAIIETLKQTLRRKYGSMITINHSSVPSPTETISEKENIATITQCDDFTNRTLKEWLNQLELIQMAGVTSDKSITTVLKHDIN
ncbi:hypothetical protein ACTA71_005033 [Dictyostelium dimigraforme]